MLSKLLVARFEAHGGQSRRKNKELTNQINQSTGSRNDSGQWVDCIFAKEDVLPWQRLIAASKKDLEAITLKWRYSGARVFPATKFYDVKVWREQTENAVAELIDNMRNRYDEIIQNARDSLQMRFRPELYPTPERLSDVFYVDIAIEPLPEPENLAKTFGLEDSLREELQKELEEKNEESLLSLKKQLWERLMNPVSDLLSKLERLLEGQDKRFHQSFITDLLETANIVRALDVFDNQRLRNAAKRIETFARRVNVDELRGNDANVNREQTASEVKKLQAAIKQAAAEDVMDGLEI